MDTLTFLEYCKQELEYHKEYEIDYEYDDYSISGEIEYTTQE